MRKLGLAFTVLVAGFALTPSLTWAQTGPDMAEIRRNEAEAEKVRAKEAAERAIRNREMLKQRDAATETRLRADEQKRVDAILATRPSLSEVQELQAEVARLKKELAETQALLKRVTEEREDFRQRLAR